MLFSKVRRLPQPPCGTSWKDTPSLHSQDNPLTNAWPSCEERGRHLPVFEGKKPIGIVSIGDLVKSIIGDQKFVIVQLEQYIHVNGLLWTAECDAERPK